MDKNTSPNEKDTTPEQVQGDFRAECEARAVLNTYGNSRKNREHYYKLIVKHRGKAAVNALQQEVKRQLGLMQQRPLQAPQQEPVQRGKANKSMAAKTMAECLKVLS